MDGRFDIGRKRKPGAGEWPINSQRTGSGVGLYVMTMVVPMAGPGGSCPICSQVFDGKLKASNGGLSVSGNARSG